MKNTALLVIDVQRGLFRRKNPVFNERQLLINIGTLIRRAHVKGVPVVFVQHSTKGCLAEGSDDWQLHPALETQADDHYIHKRCASAFEETGLAVLLRERRIDTLFVAGLATHQCVKASCLDAKKWGFDVILVSDGHSNFSQNAAKLIDHWNNALSVKNVALRKAGDIWFD
jgi:nicotinamidase-related amidase